MSNALALNSTLSQNPHAKVPDGTFDIDGSQQAFPRGNNIRVRGNGPNSTTLRKSSGKNLLELDEPISAGGTVENVKIEDLTLEMNGGGQKAVRIDTDKGQNNFGTIRNITFQNVVFSGTGISNDGSDARLVWLRGVIRGQGVTFRNCVFDMDAGAKTIGVYLAQNHPNKDRLPDDTRVRFENCRFTGGTTGIYTGVTTPARVAPLEVESCEFRDMTQTFEDVDTGAYYGRAVYAYKNGSLILNDNKFVNCHETAHKFSDGGIVWADIGSYDTSEDPELTPSIYTERSPFQIEGNYFRSCVGNAIYVEDAKGGTVSANQILDLRDRVGESISIALSQFNGPLGNVQSHGGHGILMGGGMDGCSVSHNKIKALDGHGIYQSPELSAKNKSDVIRRSKITHNHIADVGESVGPNNDTGTGIRSVSSGDFLNVSANVLRNGDGNGNATGWGIALMRNNNSELSYKKTRIVSNVLTGWQYGMHSPGSPTEGLVVSHNTFKSISEADLSWKVFVGVLGPNSHSSTANTTEVESVANWNPGEIFISDDSAVIASHGSGLGEGAGRSQLQGTTVLKRDGLSDGETLLRWEGHRDVSLVRSGGTAASASYDWRSEGNNPIRYVDQNNNPIIKYDFVNSTVKLDDTDISVTGSGKVLVDDPGGAPDGSKVRLTSPNGNPGVVIREGDGAGGTKKQWEIQAANNAYVVEDNSGNRLFHGQNDKIRIGDNTSPSAVLDSKGAVKVSSNSASAAAGMIRWTGTDFEGYDGTSWSAFGGSGSGSFDLELNNTDEASDVKVLDLNEGIDISLSGSSGNDSGEREVTISHADTSNQSDVSTTSADIVDGITLDGRGHITDLSTRTLQHSDLSTTSSDHHTKPSTGDGLTGTTTFTVDSTVARTNTAETFDDNLTVNGNVNLNNPGSSPTGSEVNITSPGGNPGVAIKEGDGAGGVSSEYKLVVGSGAFIVDQDVTSGNRLLQGQGRLLKVGDSGSPSAVLQSAGSVLVASNVETAAAGMIRWTGSDFEGYNGSSWVSLT